MNCSQLRKNGSFFESILSNAWDFSFCEQFSPVFICACDLLSAVFCLLLKVWSTIKYTTISFPVELWSLGFFAVLPILILQRNVCGPLRHTQAHQAVSRLQVSISFLYCWDSPHFFAFLNGQSHQIKWPGKWQALRDTWTQRYNYRDYPRPLKEYFDCPLWDSQVERYITFNKGGREGLYSCK